MKGLVHCIRVVSSKAVVFGPSLSQAMVDVQQELAALNLRLFSYGPGQAQIGETINEAVGRQSSAPPSLDHIKGLKLSDRCTYIYTSGTTGLPKAAIIPHQKIVTYGLRFFHSCELRTDDRIFSALPLYHSSAFLGIMSMVIGGPAFIFKKKFSTTTFWKDVTEARYHPPLTAIVSQFPQLPSFIN